MPMQKTIEEEIIDNLRRENMRLRYALSSAPIYAQFPNDTAFVSAYQDWIRDQKVPNLIH